MHKIIQDCADFLHLDLDDSLKSICEKARVNRTQVYERKKQLENILDGLELASPGRPVAIENECPDATWKLREKILLYRLDHPGAMVIKKSGRASYSDGFVRFILDLLDEWPGSLNCFCRQVAVPYATLREWCKKDENQPYVKQPDRPYNLPANASKDFRCIVEDFAIWDGGTRDFFKYEAVRMNLGPTPIRRVLVICGMLPVKSPKAPRYRGSTTRCQPGSILVTDGKTIEARLIPIDKKLTFNWQGIVDQATICHTGVVVTKTECAAGVLDAFESSCNFMGRPPSALIHDNKPIHNDQGMRIHIGKTTTMIPATLNRPENKASIEGEFGKYEQAVGTIYLDDSTPQTLIHSAVREILRAYTAGVNHAGRAEFNGKSRQQVLRETCPDPEKDRKFIEQLHADHNSAKRVDTLPTEEVSRLLLDEGFKRFGIKELDLDGKTRQWLAGRYSPEAIRQGLAIFGTERDKGRLQNDMAHRYLVKVIQNCQAEIDLRRQEEYLRAFAEIERRGWLQQLEEDFTTLKAESNGSTPEKDLAFCLSDNAVFGGLPLQRTFWENKLQLVLEKSRKKISAVCRHVRRLFEAPLESRFALISKLVAWEYQLI
ncbi:MAG: hypothetical protein U9R57_13295 [Thermodesulfobacteriota bacterium]|nr:hypothetical protein [Thermodesulfobacteriota bacterium]